VIVNLFRIESYRIRLFRSRQIPAAACNEGASSCNAARRNENSELDSRIGNDGQTGEPFQDRSRKHYHVATLRKPLV
jgi:hypothetical protein